MLPRPIDSTQAGFLAVLDCVLDRLAEDSPLLCGSELCAIRPGDGQELVYPYPRFNVVLSGNERHAISVRGKRQDVFVRPGQCLYWTAQSWTIPFRDTIGEAFGVVFLPHCVRLIQMTHQAEKGTPHWAYHTALPIDEAGIHMIRAMNSLAERDQAGAIARETLVLIVRLVRQHLEEDVPVLKSHRRAMETWHAIRASLEENFSARQLSRESVARQFKLHPNYLSNLARQSTGQSFYAVLEETRMAHARRLLRDTDLKLARIAAMCGYRNANRFSKVFRRVAGITPGRFRSSAATS